MSFVIRSCSWSATTKPAYVRRHDGGRVVWTDDHMKAKTWKTHEGAMRFCQTHLWAVRSPQAEIIHTPCPDEGRCHHACIDGECFRVRSCGPLSGVFPDDEWPYEVVLNFGGAS